VPDSVTVFFLPVEPGRRFCVYHPPAAGCPARGGMLYVHPFGEEMNKARRMAALQARRLAAAGWGVLQIDLLGCGESCGDFVDARWSAWKKDVQAGLAWLRERVGGAVGLWGLRLGATLAADSARESLETIDRLVLWQPVASGEQFLSQFLRLQLASEMLTAGAAQSGVRELREALAGGRVLEIGGYELNPEMAGAIDGLRLADEVPAVKRVHWLEVRAQSEPAITPASRRVVETWRSAGLDVRASAVAGEPFWSTLEIAECAALLDATDEAMRSSQ
jgi:exosortase A-associated hydrolase 2